MPIAGVKEMSDSVPNRLYRYRQVRPDRRRITATQVLSGQRIRQRPRGEGRVGRQRDVERGNEVARS